MNELLKFALGAVVIFIVFVAIGTAEEMKKRKMKERQIKYFLSGGMPSPKLVEVGYLFTGIIAQNGGRSLHWPYFEIIGGGSKDLYEKYLMGGYKSLSEDEKWDLIAVIGKIEKVPDWYQKDLSERTEILKKILVKPPETISS